MPSMKFMGLTALIYFTLRPLIMRSHIDPSSTDVYNNIGVKHWDTSQDEITDVKNKQIDAENNGRSVLLANVAPFIAFKAVNLFGAGLTVAGAGYVGVAFGVALLLSKPVSAMATSIVTSIDKYVRDRRAAVLDARAKAYAEGQRH